MKKTIEIKDVVSAKSVVITTYPRWSDYGCLTKTEAEEYIRMQEEEYERSFIEKE